MAQRRFMPGLRRLIVPETKSLLLAAAGPVESGPVETKRISLGVGYSSHAMIGGGYGSSGTEHRADGWDLGTVITDGYERVVWVYKSVEWYSRNQSRLPFRIGRNIGTDAAENLDDHPLLRVLNGRANPMETGRQFRKRLHAQVLLNKRGAFVEVIKSRAGTITRLDLLPPDRVMPMPDEHDGNYLSHYEYHPRYGAMRQIAPERIRWVRDPHPTDPFSGITPLEAAGISIELDHLSRIYNVSFIKNDGRPGGIVGVDTDGLEDSELERLEGKFQPGPEHAGKITVVGTGPGGLDYVDTTTKPRDMAYDSASQNSKGEILSAFGLDESVIGQVAGRTYDNAEQALYNAWTGEMPGHLDLIAGAFAEDVEGDWLPYLDTSSVEVLELPRRKKRDEARTEWRDGLRTVDEYRPLADLKPFDSPYTRALWISPSKAPIPGRPEDAAALGVAIADPNAPGAPAAGMPGKEGQPPVDGEPGAAAAAVALASQQQQPDLAGAPGAAAAAVAAAQDIAAGGVPGAAASAVALAEALEGKSLEGKALEGPASPASPQPVEYGAAEGDITRTEAALAAALDALLVRQMGVVTARLESPKARRGTRFWTATDANDLRAGAELIDPSKAVDVDRWVAESVETTAPLVQAAADSAATEMLTALAGAGVLAQTLPSDLGTAAAAELSGQAVTLTAELVGQVLAEAAAAMVDWSRGVATVIAVEQLVAPDLAALLGSVRQHYTDQAREFATGLAESLTAATVNGALESVAAGMTPLPAVGADGDLALGTGIARTWRTQGDERVRPSHKAVEGQSLPVGTPWQVGEALLRFPGDPLGPPAQVRRCRCRAVYRTTTAARLVMAPPPALTVV